MYFKTTADISFSTETLQTGLNLNQPLASKLEVGSLHWRLKENRNVCSVSITES